MNTIRITIETLIAADAKKVWNCLTDPMHIVHWNFASDDWHCPHAANDLRVGGVYKARMEAKDGSFGFDFEAVYDEVTPGKTYTYTLGDGRKATTTLEDLGNRTRVTVSFDAETMNPVEMQKQGWQAILDNCRKYAESVL